MTLTVWIILIVVLLVIAVAGYLQRDKVAALPALYAVLAGVLILGAVLWGSDRSSRDRDAAAARRDAEAAAVTAAANDYAARLDVWRLDVDAYDVCRSKVQTRLELRAQLQASIDRDRTLADLLKVAAGLGVTAFDPLIEAFRVEIDEDQHELDTKYAPYPPDECPSAPPPRPERPKLLGPEPTLSLSPPTTG